RIRALLQFVSGAPWPDMLQKADHFPAREVRALLFFLSFLLTTTCIVSGAETANKTRKDGKKETAEQFFKDEKIRVFQFEILEAGVASLRRSPRTNVTGTLREGTH